MKKILLILSVVLFSACYEDYVVDYDYSGIYFTNQTDVRSFIVGERMTFDTGAILGGVLENTSKREVFFEIAPELLTDQVLEQMRSSKYSYVKEALEGVEHLEFLPQEWYSLSNNEKMVIEKGKYAGILTITANDQFIQNPSETLKAKYALPLRITSADADSLIKGKEYTVIAVKYECKLFGNYYHYGEWTSYDAEGNETGKDAVRFSLPMSENTINELVTNAPYQVLATKAANLSGYKMLIQLNPVTNEVSLTAPEGANYTIEAAGECKYNNPKLLQDRKMMFQYKVTKEDGSYVIAKDTLAFRNRIRDGVNEWRDEDPNNYK